MNPVETKCLTDFFFSIADFRSVVLRNAAELPLENSSNDVDIAIAPQELRRFRTRLFQVMHDHGFVRMEYSRFHGIECRTFYRLDDDGSISSLKIDLFGHFEGGGVKYLDFEDIYRYCECNTHGVHVLSYWAEALLTAAKMFAAGGSLSPKYQKPFLSGKCPEAYYALINGIASVRLRKKLFGLIGDEEPDFGGISRAGVVIGCLFRNFFRNPFATIARISAHLYYESTRGIVCRTIICFVGPDGCGKSSIISGVTDLARETFRSPTKRFVLFHHRPHLLCNLGMLFRRGKMTEQEVNDETFNPHGGKTSGFVVSIVKLCWYCMDYRLGYWLKVAPLFRRANIVLFDRYFFDFLADQRRSAMNLPNWIVTAAYWLCIPKPDRVFFITVDPDDALRRKQEISRESIVGINSAYSKMAESFRCFRIIENRDLKTAIRETAAGIMLTITKPVPDDGR